MSELQCCTEIDSLRDQVRQLKSQGKVIGLVPTMGNLHAGHLKLVVEAKQRCDWVVCSIFVNPMQFGPSEDLDGYPRSLEQDKESLEKTGCDCVFCPSVDEIYPHGLDSQTVVSVPELGHLHCGTSRPGHFDGVTTVVSKLFNICQPDVATFGLKDYQQFLIIRKMVEDLLIPVELAGIETERNPDGLAISSRNSYLTDEQRRLAPVLYRTLQDTRRELATGNRDYNAIEAQASKKLTEAGLKPDYFTVCHAGTLQPARADDTELVVLAAAFLGKARLIDNIRLSLDSR